MAYQCYFLTSGRLNRIVCRHINRQYITWEHLSEGRLQTHQDDYGKQAGKFHHFWNKNAKTRLALEWISRMPQHKGRCAACRGDCGKQPLFCINTSMILTASVLWQPYYCRFSADLDGLD